jgi:hypothetical protein
MMNVLERFAQLASRARSEPVPPLDVCPSVIRDIGRFRRPAGSEPALMLSAAVSVLAASIVVMIVWDAWAPLHDPLAGILEPLDLVLR